MIVANLGDGRAVASIHCLARQLTQDHNTNNPRERERVTAMGGVIKDNRVGGVLIPTRYVQTTSACLPRIKTVWRSENESLGFNSLKH